jgi:hypothetical protein
MSYLLLTLTDRSPGSAVSLSAVQWCSVLAVATKYDMEVIRSKSVQQLKSANPPLDPIDQIIAARRYDCTELAEAPMEVLVKRKEPLSIEEMVKLSPEDLHKWILERNKSPPGTQCVGCNTRLSYCNRCGRYN